jgi:homospermidine synthase
MLQFNNKVLITGFGVVAQSALPLLLRHVDIPCRNITVIDFVDRAEQLRPWCERGVSFVRARVLPANLADLLSRHVGPGGLIIDLAWSIDFFEILQWARDHEVLYVNASLESWDPAAELEVKSLFDKSLFSRYVRALQLVSEWRGEPTAAVDQGANPGLISSFVKKGLLDIGEAVLRDSGPDHQVGRQRLEQLLAVPRFPELARELGVRAIHCSELDTQRARGPKKGDEFVATWSVEGMWEEAISPCEFAWGTHEKWEPPLAQRPLIGPANQIILPRMGMNTWVRSWVPNQEIVGMVITHGETFGISRALTVKNDSHVVYRPTVLYAYLPCNDSLLSLHELRCRNYALHPRTRILTEETCEGSDAMGALLMGHRLQSWWTGSNLSIDQGREHVPNTNATAVQVAVGLVAAVRWTIQNPTRGLCFPEDLPHDEIIGFARPYLGAAHSKAVHWSPLMHHRSYFPENPEAEPDLHDPWQFRNFLFRP